jgi:rsbT co-antagonist protein RsbR
MFAAGMHSPSVVDPSISSQVGDLTQLRQIFDRAPVMLYQWILGPDGEARFTAVSAGCQQIYGLTPAEMLADIRYSMSVVHPEDMPAFQAAVVDSAQNLVPFVWEGRVQLPGRLRWLRAHSFPTRLADGGTRWEGVILDISEQRASEAARQASEVERERLLVRLQEQNQTLLRQAEALQELATPIIPLAAGVVALPLIGDIDPARAQRVLEVLLAGVQRHRAHIALVDITGVRALDRLGAEALVRAGQALRLLGATMVLTGMRPASAQILVALDIELAGLRVLGTFQEGVAFALGSSGR